MTAALRALRERLAGAGIDCELESPRPEKPPQRATRPAAVATNTVVLGDGYSLARRVVSAARAAELEIDAVAIVTPSSIEAALLALHDSPAAANLIVALHASPKLSTLRTMARSTPGATLLCVGNARRIIDARAAVEELSTLGVARAHGIVACDVPAVSVDARALALGGLLPRGSRDVDALCVSRDVARLMRDAAVAGGLELVGKGGTRVGGVRVEPRSELADPAAAALMVSELASAGREALLVLVAPELGLADGPTHVNLGAVPPEPLRAAAVAASISPRAQRRARRRVSDASATARSTRLLDGWRAQLSEMQLKELVRCYGVAAPEERLVRSASAAGAAAAELGLPVLLRPVGADLPDEERAGELTAMTASAARQVYRDVVSRSEHGIAGVLVSRQQLRARGFSCTMLFDDEDALLQLRAHAAPGASERPIWAAPIALPDRDGEAAAAAELVRALALPRAAVAVARGFVRAMADIAADHGPRLSWIAIERVDLYADDDEGVIRLELVKGRGEQRISLRDPFA